MMLHHPAHTGAHGPPYISHPSLALSRSFSRVRWQQQRWLSDALALCSSTHCGLLACPLYTAACENNAHRESGSEYAHVLTSPSLLSYSPASTHHRPFAGIMRMHLEQLKWKCKHRGCGAGRCGLILIFHGRCFTHCLCVI